MLLFLLGLLIGSSLADYHNVKPGDDVPSFVVGYFHGKYPTTRDRFTDDHVEVDQAGHNTIDPDFNPDLSVFNPKYRPGQFINTIDQTKVSQAMDEIQKKSNLMGDRTCTVGITNVGPRVLENARSWMYSGQAVKPLSLHIMARYTATNLFVKKDKESTGSVGLVTYDIAGTDHKVAIMWNVPYSSFFYDVWFNVKVYPKSYPTGEHMYHQMYYFAGPWRASGYESRDEYGIHVTATMTENRHAKFTVFVDTSRYSSGSAVDAHAECTHYPAWVGNHCWKECHNGGYCWASVERCSRNSDCSGRMQCQDACKETH